MEEKESTLSGSSGNTDSGGSPTPISAVVSMAVDMCVDNNLGVSVTGGGPISVLDSTGGVTNNSGMFGGSGGGMISSSGGSGGGFGRGGGGAGGGSGDLLVGKKKRGRPRKYDLDGNLRPGYSQPKPKPKPAAMSSPPGFTLTPSNNSSSKRGRGKPVVSSGNGQILASLGEIFAGTAGGDFTPHILTVHAGEDVSAKILSFSQKGPRGICVLSANGPVSNVTLRQPGSAGGILTYEGRFEILSLTGSFTVSETAGMRSRSGGLSVTLAGPDGRVIGGGIGGLLTAASPIQVVVGSFMPNGYKPPKRKYHREPAVTTSIPFPDSAAATTNLPVSQSMHEHESNPPSASPSPLRTHHDNEAHHEGPGSQHNLNVVSHYTMDWNVSQNVLGQKMYPDINICAPAE